jgi:hypothetical protein
MTNSFRYAFWSGLLLALLIGAFLLRLWQPERQVQLHSEHLLRAVEHKDWTRVADFIAPDYHDQWNNDRERLLERAREALHYMRNLRFSATDVATRDNHWQARIRINVEPDELGVNALQTPFDLEWRHASGKPWDYQLVRVTNSGLTIPEFAP